MHKKNGWNQKNWLRHTITLKICTKRNSKVDFKVAFAC